MRATNNLNTFYKIYAQMSKVAPVKWYSKMFGKCEVFIVKFA